MIGSSAFVATAIVPSALAYVGHKANRDLRGSAMGIYSMMLSLGMAMGNLLEGYFGSMGELKAILGASGGLLLLSLSATLALLYRAGGLGLRQKRSARL